LNDGAHAQLVLGPLLLDCRVLTLRLVAFFTECQQNISQSRIE
jgi:hypothetical protein